MVKQFLLIIGFIFSIEAMSQTGIGTTTPNASAKLDVFSHNKGFLPPRVSLSSVTDQSTIPSPAVGLLIYCKGDAGLSAGYYYWNGNSWATIATAGGSGSFGASFLRGSRSSAQTTGLTNGGTVVFNQVDNSAGQEMSLNTSTGQITLAAGRTYRLMAQVPNFQTTSGETRLQLAWYNETSGAYIGSSSSSYPPLSGAAFGTTGGLSEAIITTTTSTVVSYRIIQITTASQLGGNSDFNLTGSFPWFEAQVISGNAPVTGQSVDYVSVSTISQSAIGDNRDLIFTSNNGGNIPYNTSTGVFTLSANKTYLFQAQIRSNGASADGSYIEYGFVDAISNTLLVNGTQTITSSTTRTAGFGSNPVINFIYTPTSNQTVKLRTTATTVGTQNITSGTANITQIGSSAIINPWVLSGNNVYNTTGNVGIGTATPNASAILDLSSTTQGILIPRMTSSQRAAIANPVAGLVVYQTNANPGNYVYNGSSWDVLSNANYGDVKTGIQTADHNGWVMLDGRAKSSLSATQQDQATTLGIGTTLPNAADAFLVQNGTALGSVSGSNSKTLTQANLPNVSFQGSTNTTGLHDHTGSVNGVYTSSGTNSGGTFPGGAGYYFKVGNLNINQSGNHSHTVSVSSGGSGAALNITPRSLSVNTFIYLGF